MPIFPSPRANDLDGTYKLPGQLYTITQIVSKLRCLSFSDNARLFALVGLALGDAAILAWDAKYDTDLDLWRPDSNLDDYMAYAQCCLAFVKSCSNFSEDAFYVAEDAFSAISSSTRVTLWGIGHSLISLCLTYKNLGNLEKSFDFCQKAILSSEENNFPQLNAKAISCLPGLYREQKKLLKRFSIMQKQ